MQEAYNEQEPTFVGDAIPTGTIKPEYEQDIELSEDERYEEPTQEPEVDHEFQAWTEKFKKYTGIEFEQVVQRLKQPEETAQPQAVNAEQQLAQEWGVQGEEFQNRLQAVRQRFAQLPPELQKVYDNVEGAKLLWAEMQLKQTPAVPKLDRTQTPQPTKTKYMYTQRDILKMSKADYAKQADRISYAYANGLVKF